MGAGGVGWKLGWSTGAGAMGAGGGATGGAAGAGATGGAAGGGTGSGATGGVAGGASGAAPVPGGAGGSPGSGLASGATVESAGDGVGSLPGSTFGGGACARLMELRATRVATQESAKRSRMSLPTITRRGSARNPAPRRKSAQARQSQCELRGRRRAPRARDAKRLGGHDGDGHAEHDHQNGSRAQGTHAREEMLEHVASNKNWPDRKFLTTVAHRVNGPDKHWIRLHF